MATRTERAERRTDSLSKERIVATAIAILDAGGEEALTFRALAARLATGSGAIYWHVADKQALLAAATGAMIGRAMATPEGGGEPGATIRAVALALFDLIDAHPWVGAALAREPWQSAMLDIFERFGGALRALGVPEPALFDGASALVNYVLGCAGQNAANARLLPAGTDRTAFLAEFAAQWSTLDPDRYPFVRQMARTLRDHDDRGQFMAGIELILAGAATLR